LRRSYLANDGYVARFSRDGRQLLYATYLGGSGHDGAWYVARHAAGVVNVIGQTYSADLPIQNARQPGYQGNGDMFITRLQTVPTDTALRGRPTLGGNGYPTIHALSDAVSGNTQFGLACTRAPANASGVLLLAWQGSSGVPAFGIEFYVDPNAILISALMSSNAQGERIVNLPIPLGVVPTLHTQFVWIESVSPLRLSASEALQIH
jgi:hypothetical protein